MTAEDRRRVPSGQRMNADRRSGPLLPEREYVRVLTQRAVAAANGVMYEVKGMTDNQRDEIRRILRGEQGYTEIPQQVFDAFQTQGLLIETTKPSDEDRKINRYELSLPEEVGRPATHVVDVPTVYSEQKLKGKQHWYLQRYNE